MNEHNHDLRYYRRSEVDYRLQPAQLLARLQQVDGAGSGLDADTLDGWHAADYLAMWAAPVPGDWWGKRPYIANDGVMEIGKYIDFHESDTGTTDYDYRIYSSGGELYTTGRMSVGSTYASTAMLNVAGIESNLPAASFIGNGIQIGLNIIGGTGAAGGTGWRSMVIGSNVTLGADNVPEVKVADGTYNVGYAIGFPVESTTDPGLTFWSGVGVGDMTKRVTMLNNGNVGIGTASPQGKLHVAGSILIDGHADYGVAGTITLTDVYDYGGSYGYVWSPATYPSNNIGWIQVFLGTQVGWIPVFNVPGGF